MFKFDLHLSIHSSMTHTKNRRESDPSSEICSAIQAWAYVCVCKNTYIYIYIYVCVNARVDMFMCVRATLTS